MIGACLAVLLSHWRQRPGLAAALLAGLALATALWTGVQAINSEARASYDRAAAVIRQNDLPMLVAADGGTIPVAEYVRLRRAGWTLAPFIEGDYAPGGDSVTILGLDPLVAPVVPGGETGDAEDGGNGSAFAAFIGPPGQLLGDAASVAALRGRLGPEPPELVISSDMAPDTLIGDIGTVSKLLGRQGLDRLAVLENQRPGLTPLDVLAPGLTLTQPGGGTDPGSLTDAFHLNLTAFGLLSFAVGLFIVHGAVGLAFEQRRGTVRTMRALGVPLGMLTGALLAELAVFALVGGLLGVAIGYGIAASLLPDVAATLRGLYGAAASGTLSIRPVWIAAGLAMTAIGTLAAAGQSLLRLRQMPLLAPAQPRAWRHATESGYRRQALAGAALLGASVCAIWLGSGLVAAFAALGLLFLGAALMLPPVLALALAAAEARSGRALIRWFWADNRQQLPALSLALMALLLALSANIGVSAMVGSFRASFTDWLDQRLSADLYVDALTVAEAEMLATGLAGRAEAVLTRAQTETRLDGLPGEVEGLAALPAMFESWPLLTAEGDVWDRFAAGEGALISEQYANLLGLTLGDAVSFAGAEMPVLGIYPDYGNPRPQAAIPLKQFGALFPDVQTRQARLFAASGETDLLRRSLVQEFGLPASQIGDQNRIKAASLAIFERTFSVTAALNVLTLGVAAMAMLTSLLTLATLRLPQIAPLWAIGVTRGTIGWLELLRTAILAALTAILAVPLGLALAWVLLAIVNVEAFGWRLPLRLFPGDWARLAAVAVGAALMAAAWPSWRIARHPPDRLLRIFTNER